MKNFYVSAVLFSVFFSSQVLFADSYENYGKYGDGGVNYIAAAETGKHWGIYDGLRNSIKDAVGKGLADPDSIDKNGDLDETVRKIVREEIKNALQQEKKKYATAGVFEIGGYVSGQLHSPYCGNDGERANVVFTSGVMNFFPVDNAAFSLKGSGEFDISRNHQLFYVGMGPLFAFGLNSTNRIALYFSIYGCLVVNSFFHDKYGWRYCNEIGLKFGVGRVVLNIGVTAGFESNKIRSSSKFDTVVNPLIGITAWL